MFQEATAQSRCQTLCSSKVNLKIKWLEVEKGHVSKCPTAGDASDWDGAAAGVGVV